MVTAKINLSYPFERSMHMSEALNLYRLQNLDNKIDQITNRLNEIEEKLSDDHRVRQAKKVHEKAEADSKLARIELHQIEDKVEAQRIKRKTNHALLFGGKVRNPKELQDLQMESEAINRYIAQLEDEQLEAMITFESAEKEEKQALINLEKAKAGSIENNAALIGEQSNLQEELERFVREKEAVLKSIPAEALQLYNKLRKTKRGTAITTVSDGGCSICGQALTPAVHQSIRASNKIVYCPSCGRILFES